VLYLLCGPAFSGKSTLAKALQARGALRIALDEILLEGGMSPGDGLPPALWEDASLEACRRLRGASRTGSDVVLDDTLCFRFLRDRYRQVTAECGHLVRLVVLRVEAGEIHRRVAENQLRPRRAGIRPEVLQAHLTGFEWPTPDEHAIELDGTLPIDRQLALLRTA
jgi:predicted kinase